MTRDGCQVPCISPALGAESPLNFLNLPNAWSEKPAHGCWQAVCFRALLCTRLLPDLLANRKTGDRELSCFLHLVPNRKQRNRRTVRSVPGTPQNHTLGIIRALFTTEQKKKKFTYWLKAESRRWQPAATDGKRASFLTVNNRLRSHPESQTCTRESEQGCRQCLAG